MIICGECGYRFEPAWYENRTNCPVCGQLYLQLFGDLYKAELMLELE